MPLSPSEVRLVNGELQTSGGVSANSVGDTEVDNDAQFNWTNRHDWSRTVPSTTQHFFTRYEDADNGTALGWYLSDNGTFRLDRNGNILIEVDPTGSPNEGTFNSVWEAILGFIAGDFVDHGNNREMRTTYNGTRDGFAIRDQTNGLDRAEVDRTTGDLTIEGSLTEGANL